MFGVLGPLAWPVDAVRHEPLFRECRVAHDDRSCVRAALPFTSARTPVRAPDRARRRLISISKGRWSRERRGAGGSDRPERAESRLLALMPKGTLANSFVNGTIVRQARPSA